MKRAIVVFAALAVAVSALTTGAFAQEEPPANVQVMVNDAPVLFAQPLLMVDMQYPLLPADPYLTALGATFNWNPAAQQFEAELGDATLLMWVDRDWATVNGVRRPLEGGLQVFSDTPYVHGPEIASLLGLDVRWDRSELTLTVLSPTIMPQGLTVTATLLEVLDPPALLVRDGETDLIEQIALAEEPVIQRGAADEEPFRANLADLQPGDRLEIVLDETTTAVGLRAVYSQTLGTIASIENNRLTLRTGESYPLGEGVEAVGSDGAPLHLLAAVGQGAILTQNPATNAVWRILAQRRGTVTPPPTDVPVIAAFTLPRYDAPLGEGDALSIHIVGSAGATANVELGTTGHGVGVPETEPGVYSGVMDVPADMLIPEEHLMAQLEIDDATSEAVRSNRAVMIDSQPPVIEQPMPEDGATITDVNANIRVSFHDGDGIGIDPMTATLTLNGTNVTDDARIDETSIFFDPPGELALGPHTASASVADELGNTTTLTWNWTVRDDGRGIRSVSHDADEPLTPGDTLTVTVEVAEPGEDVSFSIDEVVENVAMARVGETNTFQGAYVVRQGDAAADATVSASFTAADGTEYQANAPVPVTITAPEIPFAITTPAEGAQTERRIRPAGTAPPGSRVRWTVSYQALILAGDISSGTVVADAAGNWQAANQVDLRLLLIGMADRYTLQAELLDDAGQVQETRTVEFRAGG